MGQLTRTSLRAFGPRRVGPRTVGSSVLGGVACLLLATAVGCGGGPGVQPDVGADADTASERDSADADSGEDPENVQAVLEEEGVTVTGAAVYVASKNTNLEKPVAVNSSPVSGVTDETPLPEEADHVGDLTVEASAGRDVDISTEKQGLFMILPVPSSFDGDPSNLAAASRVPARLAQAHPDQYDPSRDYFWNVHTGYYVPKANAFAFPVHSLHADGSAYALMASDDYNANVLEFPDRDFGASNSTQQGLHLTRGQPLIHKTKVGKAVGDAVKSVADAVGEAFEKVGEEVSEEVKKAVKNVADTVDEAKKCVNNKGWKLRDNFFIKCRELSCSEAEKDQLRAHLNTVHDQYQSAFNKPDLTRTVPCKKIEVQTDGGETKTVWGRFYVYNLREDGTGQCSGDTGGMYLYASKSALTCYDGSGPSNISERTTRMEYFHAVQYNYPPVSWPNWITDGTEWSPNWILEGTASAVENPNTTPTEMFRDGERGNGTLRTIDRPLRLESDDRNPAYRIQDFWTYMVNVRDSTPKETFIPIFDKQSSAPNKPGLNKLKSLFNLESLYWGWVRNQAFEADMTEGFGGDLGDMCVPNEDTWNSLKTTLQYDPSSRSNPLRESIEVEGDWVAKVAKVEVNNGSSSPARISISVDGNQPVKLYRDRSSANRDCLNRNEPVRSSSLADTFTSGESQTYYILMANLQKDSDVPVVGNETSTTFDVTIDHRDGGGDDQRPTARIVKPSGGSEIGWLNETLEAQASDPGGIALYDWKVEHANASIDDVNGNGDNNDDGNPVTLDDLPDDGTVYDDEAVITLTVTDFEGDSVTVTETRKPQVCRPLGKNCSTDGECCSGICAKADSLGESKCESTGRCVCVGT